MLATKSHVTYRHILAPFLAPLLTADRSSRRNYAAQLQLLRQRQHQQQLLSQQRSLWGFSWNSKEEIARETVQKAQQILAQQEQQEKELQEKKELREKERREKKELAKQRQREREEQEKLKKQSQREQIPESSNNDITMLNSATVGSVLETPPVVEFIPSGGPGISGNFNALGETGRNSSRTKTESPDSMGRLKEAASSETASLRKEKYLGRPDEEDLPLQTSSLKDNFKEYPKSKRSYPNQSAEQMLGLKSEDAASRLAAMLSQVNLDSNIATSGSIGSNSALGATQDYTTGLPSPAWSSVQSSASATSLPSLPAPTSSTPENNNKDDEDSTATASAQATQSYSVSGVIDGIESWSPPFTTTMPNWPTQPPPAWNIPSNPSNSPSSSLPQPPKQQQQQPAAKPARSPFQSESLIDWMSRPPSDINMGKKNQRLNRVGKTVRDPNPYRGTSNIGTAPEQKLMDDYLDRWSSNETESGDKEMETWENLEDKEPRPIPLGQGNKVKAEPIAQGGDVNGPSSTVDVRPRINSIAKPTRSFRLPKVAASSSQDDPPSITKVPGRGRALPQDMPSRRERARIKQEEAKKRLVELEKEKEEIDGYREVFTGSLDFPTQTEQGLSQAGEESAKSLKRDNRKTAQSRKGIILEVEEFEDEFEEFEDEVGPEEAQPKKEPVKNFKQDLKLNTRIQHRITFQPRENGIINSGNFRKDPQEAFMRYSPPRESAVPIGENGPRSESSLSQKKSGQRQISDEDAYDEYDMDDEYDYDHEEFTEPSTPKKLKDSSKINSQREAKANSGSFRSAQIEAIKEENTDQQGIRNSTTGKDQVLPKKVKAGGSSDRVNINSTGEPAKIETITTKQKQSPLKKSSKQPQHPRVGTPHTGDSFETYSPSKDSDVQFPRNIPERLPLNTIATTSRYEALRQKLEAGLKQLRELEEAEQSRSLVERDVESTLAELQTAAQTQEQQQQEQQPLQPPQESQQYMQQQSYLQEPYYSQPQSYAPQPPPHDQFEVQTQYPPYSPQQPYPPHDQQPQQYHTQYPINHWDQTLQQEFVSQDELSYSTTSQDTQWHHPEQQQYQPEQQEASLNTQDPSAWKQYITDIQEDVKAYEMPGSAPAWEGSSTNDTTAAQAQDANSQIITPYSVSTPEILSPLPSSPPTGIVSKKKKSKQERKKKERVFIENPGKGDAPPKGWCGEWDPDGAAVRKMQRILKLNQMRIARLEEDAENAKDEQARKSLKKEINVEKKKLKEVETSMQRRLNATKAKEERQKKMNEKAEKAEKVEKTETKKAETEKAETEKAKKTKKKTKKGKNGE